MKREAEGHVVLAEVADLNVDGSREIYVYVQLAGSGSYASLVAYKLAAGEAGWVLRASSGLPLVSPGRRLRGCGLRGVLR